MTMNRRILALQTALAREHLDALIVSLPANISYLAGFKARDAYAIISKKQNFYITDSRYTEEVRPQLKGFALKIITGSLFKLIAASLIELGARRIGFEGRQLAFAEARTIKESLGATQELISTHSLVETLRQVKDTSEIELIGKATAITVKALEFAGQCIAAGRTELEIAGELERFIRCHGAYASAFDIIVGSGPNSSYPHHLTGSRKIKRNEPVLVDMGVDFMGYKSDLTRVFFLGKINSFAKKAYEAVRAAQQKAIAAIAPGVSGGAIDHAARSYLTGKGFGKLFTHNTGHGVGLEVHEEPHIAKKAKAGLQEGMVFTVEPGIYFPGKFGIRIEDMVLVTAKGAHILSGYLDK